MMSVRLPRMPACRMNEHLRVLARRLPCRRLAARTWPFCRFPPVETELVEKPLNLAVGLLRRRTSLAAWTSGRTIVALQIDCMTEPLLIALLIEKSLQPPQFPNQRGLLLADRPDIVGIMVARGLAASGKVAHGTAPAAKRETRLFGPAAPARTAERATRAKTSSRGPKAIDRPP